MTKPHRQKYGLGSIIKKAAKAVKKVVKSPIGKAALIGGGLWGLNKYGIGSGGMGKNWWSKAMGSGPGKFLMGSGMPKGPPSQGGGTSRGILGGAWDWMKGNKGQSSSDWWRYIREHSTFFNKRRGRRRSRSMVSTFYRYF